MKIAGLTVVDAKKKLTVHISNQDVAKGHTKDPSSCAAALACRREVAGCTEAKVHLGRTYLKVGNKWVRHLTPASLRSEIIAFDRGADFAAGEYILQRPTPSQRAQAGMQQGSAKNGAKRTKPNAKKRGKYHVVQGVRPYGANR